MKSHTLPSGVAGLIEEGEAFRRLSAEVLIVGAGPAGLMLAYQLASAGIAVRVFERHASFDREFRGEFLQPSLIETLRSMGLLAALEVDGRVAPVETVKMHFLGRLLAASLGDREKPAGVALSQAALLQALDAQCRRFPGYALEMGAPVSSLIREQGRVCGIVVRRRGAEERVIGRYVVVCNGRSSALREQAGVQAVELQKPYSLLWLRLDASKMPEAYPTGLAGYVTRKAFAVFYPTYDRKVQVMWMRNDAHPLDLKLPAATLRSLLSEDAPAAFRGLVDAGFTDTCERQILRVGVDRLKTWHAPGVLFLGDAAHTMSAIGGQGLNLAVRDSIVAANHLVDALQAGKEPDTVAGAIEAERRPEIEVIQALQVRLAKAINLPFLVRLVVLGLIVPTINRLRGKSQVTQMQFGITKVVPRFLPPVELVGV
jgi:2-polyprenyl-6-methoxyphenol hydroxylase-like FAD-dependent oxidoreductase